MEPTRANYRVILSPDRQTIAALAGHNPCSPFSGHAYADAMIRLGRTPCAIIPDEHPPSAAGCMAFIDGPAGLRKFFVPSAPQAGNAGELWSAVFVFCREQGVSDVLIETFASHNPSPPPRGPGVSRESRYEYRLHLDSSDLFAGLSKNHKRNVRTARAHEFRIHRTADLEAVDAHCDLVIGSLARRESKGQEVDVGVNRPMILSLVESGCAEIWQAFRDDACQSSVVLLKSPKSAYYHSAGTSDQGLDSGASAFLILTIAEHLRNEGLELFNLGGAGEDASGLRRFKRGFGAEEISLFRSRVRLVSGPRRFARKLRRRIARLAPGANS